MSLMLYFANATAGVRLTHGVVDGRDLKLKSNALLLHEDTVLDVPAASAAAMRTQTGGSSSCSSSSCSSRAVQWLSPHRRDSLL